MRKKDLTDLHYRRTDKNKSFQHRGCQQRRQFGFANQEIIKLVTREETQ